MIVSQAVDTYAAIEAGARPAIIRVLITQAADVAPRALAVVLVNQVVTCAVFAWIGRTFIDIRFTVRTIEPWPTLTLITVHQIDTRTAVLAWTAGALVNVLLAVTSDETRGAHTRRVGYTILTCPVILAPLRTPNRRFKVARFTRITGGALTIEIVVLRSLLFTSGAVFTRIPTGTTPVNSLFTVPSLEAKPTVATVVTNLIDASRAISTRLR